MKSTQTKSKVVAVVLAVLFGVIGFHRFYLGKLGTGFAQFLLTIFGLNIISAIWVIVDIILIVDNKLKYEE